MISLSPDASGVYLFHHRPCCIPMRSGLVGCGLVLINGLCHRTQQLYEKPRLTHKSLLPRSAVEPYINPHMTAIDRHSSHWAPNVGWPERLPRPTGRENVMSEHYAPHFQLYDLPGSPPLQFLHGFSTVQHEIVKLKL